MSMAFGSRTRHRQAAGATTAPAPEPAPAPTWEAKQDSSPDELPTDGTINEVLDWVGIDKERAQEALDAEQGQDKPRKTLVSALESLLA